MAADPTTPPDAGPALDAVRDALEAVLLFHSGGPWTRDKAFRWGNLTNCGEATTRVLCDRVRAALAGLATTKGETP